MSATPIDDNAGDWTAAPERSNLLALRVMSAIATACGRRVARLVLAPIALYYVLFCANARRQSARYLARALGRPATWRDVYRHIHHFAAVTLDRVYLLRGRTDLFNITLQDAHIAMHLTDDTRGGFLLGAHLGSFEVLRVLGESRAKLRIAMVMYLNNARKINDTLNAIAPGSAPTVIHLGRMESMLAVRDWLDQGGVAGILGDRALPGDSLRAAPIMVPFLGRPAPFSDGPLRMAAMLRRRVIFMCGVYLGGNRYDVSFHELADFSAPGLQPEGREALVKKALADYVAHLEAVCRAHPMNWFNFHDFWREDVLPREA